MGTHVAVKKSKSLLFTVLLGIAATAVAAVAFTPAFSGFTASINNTNNNIASGTLLMTETQGATTCLSSSAGTVTAANAGTCSTINKLGGATAAAPGTVYTSTVTLTNNGTLPANTFTLTPGGCTVTANGANNGTDTTGFCGKVNITVEDTTSTTALKCVLPASANACAAPSNSTTLASIGTTPVNLPVPVAPGASKTFKFSVQIDNSATNAHQGLAANETLLWSFAN